MHTAQVVVMVRAASVDAAEQCDWLHLAGLKINRYVGIVVHVCVL